MIIKVPRKSERNALFQCGINLMSYKKNININMNNGSADAANHLMAA
jgi:hypothetical protein